MSIQLYKLLGIILYPIIILYLFKRRKAGKEDKNTSRFKERFGKFQIERPDGKLVWIHGASVGETMSILTIVQYLLEKHSDLHILVTSGTITSAKLMSEKLPNRAFHQYIVIDQIFCVNRFLKHFRPDTAILTESELWPILISEARKQIPNMLLLNARMSDNSFNKWQKRCKLAKQLIGSFNLIIAASKNAQQKYQLFTDQPVKYYGNLKFASPMLTIDSQELHKLQNMTKDRTIFLAASTHHNEEDQITNAHLKLQAKYPDLLTIIVPRHPHRGSEIKTICLNKNLQCAIRSKSEIITQNTTIYIADTIGELGIFYTISNIVFMGGSLINHGGQNPIEPAKMHNAILVGFSRENFLEIYNSLEEAGGCILVTDEKNLALQIDNLISDKHLRNKVIENAYKLVADKNIMANISADLDKFIK